MKITLIAMGNKMPSWVADAVFEYRKRLDDLVTLTLVEIPLLRRGKITDCSRIMEKETALLQAAIPPSARLIALDSRGETFNSEQLANKIARLQQITSHLCFIIGGPEGLSSQLIARSDERWSLSMLTLPHTLARISLLEALYRAWSILAHHPYHK